MDSVTWYLRFNKPLANVIISIEQETGRTRREIVEYILERYLRLDILRGIDLELAIDDVRTRNAEQAAQKHRGAA